MLLLLPYHILNRTIWLLSSLLGREDPWNQVHGKLIIGRLLRSTEAPEATSFTIDLTCEFSECARALYRIRVLPNS